LSFIPHDTNTARHLGGLSLFMAGIADPLCQARRAGGWRGPGGHLEAVMPIGRLVDGVVLVATSRQ